MAGTLSLTPTISEALREFREGLDRLYGDRLSKLVLFGSRARGDAREDSDIDVLVVLRGPVKTGEEIERTSELKYSLCLKYDVAIACIYVSETDFEQRRSPFLAVVRREGVTL